MAKAQIFGSDDNHRAVKLATVRELKSKGIYYHNVGVVCTDLLLFIALPFVL